MMKPTDDLRKRLKAAATYDEAKRAIEEAGRQLTDDELEQAAGGVRLANIMHKCPICKGNHEFLTTSPWCIINDGDIILDGMQYWSPTCIFAEGRDRCGRLRYFDEYDNPLPM